MVLLVELFKDSIGGNEVDLEGDGKVQVNDHIM